MAHAELIGGIRVSKNDADTMFQQIQAAGAATELNIFEIEDMLYDRVLFAPAFAYPDSEELVQIRTEMTFCHRDSETGVFTFYQVNREYMNYRVFTLEQDEDTGTPIRDHVMASVMDLMLSQNPAVPYDGHSFPLSGDQLQRIVDIVPCGLSIATHVDDGQLVRKLTIHVLVRLYNEARGLIPLDTTHTVCYTAEGEFVHQFDATIGDKDNPRHIAKESDRHITKDNEAFFKLIQKDGPFNLTIIMPYVE